MFKKHERVTLFRDRDKETWKKIKDLLKEEKIKGLNTGHYIQEKIIPGGCASQIDPRNLGPRGKIDRNIYYVKVWAEEEDRALNALQSAGIATRVRSEEELAQDAADKPENQMENRL